MKALVTALIAFAGLVNFGPLINADAQKKTADYIEIGKKEGKLLLGGTIPSQEGYFVAPTIFDDIPPKARLSQEEIFGPVLALTKAKDFDDALRIVNDTEYGLTGSVYTKTKENMEKARREFFVGNLYFNRKCRKNQEKLHEQAWNRHFSSRNDSNHDHV